MCANGFAMQAVDILLQRRMLKAERDARQGCSIPKQGSVKVVGGSPAESPCSPGSNLDEQPAGNVHTNLQCVHVRSLQYVLTHVSHSAS